MNRFKALIGAVLFAGTPVAALAHHGWSSYDEEKPITLSGPLRNVTFSNPHATAQMNWQGRQWDVVLAPVARLQTRGLAQDMIAGGQRVTITGYARRDGTPEVRLERIVAGDRTVELR